MENRLIFLCDFLLVSRDGEGYISQILVTGLNRRGVED
jgi:hypothetical protein